MLMGLFGKKTQRVQKSVELDAKLFRRIDRVLSAHPGEQINSHGIAHFQSGSSEKQKLEVVGESFCQNDIKENFKPEKWVYGLLIPEQSNKADPNAVAIYLITKDFGVVRVGYLKREMARKVSQKIANLMVNEGLVIPVLAIVHKAEDKESFGVFAYAMTDYIEF